MALMLAVEPGPAKDMSPRLLTWWKPFYDLTDEVERLVPPVACEQKAPFGAHAMAVLVAVAERTAMHPEFSRQQLLCNRQFGFICVWRREVKP
jgi:hypothetical protein